MTDFTVTSKELSLHEMLADPIVQTVMKRDGVTRHQIEGLIEATRERLGSGQLNGQRPGRYGVTDHAS